MLPYAMAASCDPLCPLKDLTSGMVFSLSKSVYNPRERGSPRLARILAFHQLGREAPDGTVERCLPHTRSLGSRPPPLPSGEPALYQPRGPDDQIGQLLIRHAIQEIVDLRPCRPRPQAAQRHRFPRQSFLTRCLG